MQRTELEASSVATTWRNPRRHCLDCQTRQAFEGEAHRQQVSHGETQREIEVFADEMVVDIMTEALAVVKFTHFRKTMKVLPVVPDANDASTAVRLRLLRRLLLLMLSLYLNDNEAEW
ncbi:hypothetical protein PC110_g9147 [Phytophthora cactorum]|uniref:Uncharacterized protein n=2 Tax=Phytophthora cactorum TaxID=29920 RepID=A0A329RTR3_9STRA|nr:hypothetical protein PC110_g17087 [Phytophthora cactorum]RAW34544.1 hypothetical protein PC110_g9147 [Phytophthora cactorum]